MASCGVCYSNYSEAQAPVLASCGHTICQKCATSPQLVACPFCRGPLPRDRWALPRNYALLEALEAVGVEEQTGADLLGQLGIMIAPDGRRNTSSDPGNGLSRQRQPAPAGVLPPDFRSLVIPRDELTLTDQELGAGSSGRVMLGHFRGREVAVKLMPLASSPDAREPLAREVRLLARVSAACRHSARLLGLSAQGDMLALVMARYPASLAQHLQRQPGCCLPPGVALLLARDLLRGLCELHSLGVVMADLKPDNVLLDAQGQALLADFGLARAVTSTLGAHLATSPQGTLQYMAPEQFAVDSLSLVSPQADIWAVGATLLHVLTGEAPWAGLHMGQVTMQVGVNRRPPPIPSSVPGPLAALIKRCMSPEPKNRPSAAAALAMVDEALCEALGRGLAGPGRVSDGGEVQQPGVTLVAPATPPRSQVPPRQAPAAPLAAAAMDPPPASLPPPHQFIPGPQTAAPPDPNCFLAAILAPSPLRPDPPGPHPTQAAEPRRAPAFGAASAASASAPRGEVAPAPAARVTTLPQPAAGGLARVLVRVRQAAPPRLRMADSPPLAELALHVAPPRQTAGEHGATAAVTTLLLRRATLMAALAGLVVPAASRRYLAAGRDSALGGGGGGGGVRYQDITQELHRSGGALIKVHRARSGQQAWEPVEVVVVDKRLPLPRARVVLDGPWGSVAPREAIEVDYTWTSSQLADRARALIPAGHERAARSLLLVHDDGRRGPPLALLGLAAAAAGEVHFAAKAAPDSRVMVEAADGLTVGMPFHGSWLVQELKAEIASSGINIPPDEQALTVNRQPMEDWVALSEYNLRQDGSAVHVLHRSRH